MFLDDYFFSGELVSFRLIKTVIVPLLLQKRGKNQDTLRRQTLSRHIHHSLRALTPFWHSDRCWLLVPLFKANMVTTFCAACSFVVFLAASTFLSMSRFDTVY